MKEESLQCLPETTVFISAKSIPENNNSIIYNTSANTLLLLTL